MASSGSFETSPVERLLAAMVAGIVGLSVVSFFAIVIGTWQGMSSDDFTAGIWPIVTVTPLIGLPLGIVLIISLLIVSTLRRSKKRNDESSE